jgi:hypothetical protein
MQLARIAIILLLLAAAVPCRAQRRSKLPQAALPYCIVDTGQTNIFSDRGQLFTVPQPGEPFFGQDGCYQIHPLSYTLSNDGLTVYDNHTGLTWQRSPDSDDSRPRRDKATWAQAQARPAALNAAKFGGYSDWRLPSIKELYSLMDFRGTDPRPTGTDTSGLRPFIDTNYFKFSYGQTSLGERIIDAQYWSSTEYVGLTMNASATVFGVNFADGRIKGYPRDHGRGGQTATHFLRLVRGNPAYGKNDFVDNQDQTITDRATGLMWSKTDSHKGLNWQESLACVQVANQKNYLHHNDWRLPTAKELQSIVDYTRSPSTTHSAAIDPLFSCTPITNEAGQADYPCYWTGTAHGTAGGQAAVYIAFGRAMGYMMGAWRDVHGAGAQRSDPKAGNPADYPQGRGPQGDAIRIYNYVRLVRNIDPQSVRLVQPDLTPLPVPSMTGGPGRGPGNPAGPVGAAGGQGVGLDSPGRGPGGPGVGFHLMPWFAVEQMNLTPAQQERIATLEKEAKARLDKILTPEQQKALDEARPPMPGGPGDGPGMDGPGSSNRVPRFSH